MQRIKLILLAVVIIIAMGMASWPTPVVAENAAAPVASVSTDDKGPGKDAKGKDGKAKDDKGKVNQGKDDKSNDDKGKGNSGNGSANAGAPAQGRSDERGLAGWLRSFRARFLGRAVAGDFGGWQLGRFKDAFPFAYPQGWERRERGDALVLGGPWQGREYLFQLTRTVQVDHDSLRDWVESDLDRLGLTGDRARFVDAGRTQVAVITGVNDSSYDCPVAYVYLWTQNPAGNNQRQALGVVSQAPGAACDTAALNAFVDEYLARVGEGQRPFPLVTPTAPVTPIATNTAPAPTATPAVSGWQRTLFFNAFSFAYPPGWTMDRLGDTAHLQGNYQNRAYVMDVVWVRSTPQNGLEQWVRADLTDLGAAMERVRIDYARQGDAQFALVTGVSISGYACPVVRIYVIADNPAGDGGRAFAATVAQGNGQPCDPAALENLVYQMLQQA